MNRFAIYGPLTVEGRKMSASRRNIHVPLKDAIGSVPTQHQPKSKKGWKKNPRVSTGAVGRGARCSARAGGTSPVTPSPLEHSTWKLLRRAVH